MKIVWLIGSAAMIAAVICGWLRIISFGAVFLTILVFGGAATIAGWLARNHAFEELPE
jgi:hypothetical protein